MPPRPYDQNCSIARALEVLGERWTLLIMRDVLLGSRHFNELKRSLGVAPNILSDRLDSLVSNGLLERRDDRSRADSIAYVPTRRGVDVNKTLVALMDWGDEHRATTAGPPRAVVHTVCGHDTSSIEICDHCGEPVDPRDVASRPGPGATPEQRAQGLLPPR